MSKPREIILLGLAIGTMLEGWPARAGAQEVKVRAQIAVSGAKAEKKSANASGDLSNIVLWLSPADGRALGKPSGGSAAPPAITQQNKSFTPHVSAVQVGTSVQFPNRDRILHNVFSLHDGRQFDLGFYEAGSAKSVRFDKLGVSYLFCNIHPEMTAAVVTVDTPYFAVSDSAGHVTIPDVAEGKYILHVWWEQSLSEDLKKLEREVTVNSGRANLGVVMLTANPRFTSQHKNKYGQDYIPPAGIDYNRP
jgi:plastocyanin